MTMTARRNIILIVAGLILLGVVAPMFLGPLVVALRPVLDEMGNQVFWPDGKPKLEIDPIGQFKLNWGLTRS
jgi:hypothetical protein